VSKITSCDRLRHERRDLKNYVEYSSFYERAVIFIAFFRKVIRRREFIYKSATSESGIQPKACSCMYRSRAIEHRRAFISSNWWGRAPSGRRWNKASSVRIRSFLTGRSLNAGLHNTQKI